MLASMVHDLRTTSAKHLGLELSEIEDFYTASDLSLQSKCDFEEGEDEFTVAQIPANTPAVKADFEGAQEEDEFTDRQNPGPMPVVLFPSRHWRALCSSVSVRRLRKRYFFWLSSHWAYSDCSCHI